MTFPLASLSRGHRRVARPQDVPAQYSSWRYLVISSSDNTDYSSPTFDDSGWLVGPSPFGNADNATPPGYYSGPSAYDSRFSDWIATKIPLDGRVWIRRTVTLSSIPAGGFTLVGFFDNIFVMYVNGVLVAGGSTPTNGGITTNISADNFVVGVNSIAVQCTDTGSSSANVCYFDFLLDPA